MAVPVMMPRQGQSVESCIISEWVKKKGETVQEGEVILVYETDKASFELESPASGVLLETFFDEDDDVPVLTNVAVVGQSGEPVAEFHPDGTSMSRQPEEQPAASAVPDESTEKASANKEQPEAIPGSSTSQDMKISPRARNFAENKGLDLNQLKIIGSGPYGRIIEQDLIDYIDQHPQATPLAREMVRQEQKYQPDQGSGLGGQIRKEDLTSAPEATKEPLMDTGDDFETKKVSNIRRIIAENMHKSLQNSAQLTHHTSADARRILDLRKLVKQKLTENGGANITLNDMVCYAVIRALKKHPEANSHFLGDSIRTYKKVHLGIAVDTERGLMVPALKNADDFNLAGLSNQLKQLAAQSKKGSLDPELLASTAASFTVSNLGAYDIEIFTPVINLPQAGILGVNTIIHRPRDLGDGTIAFVPHIGLSLTYDHRALDGAPASRFLKAIKDEIEHFDYSID
ncbi:MAG: dihydrolipoamide acetyltransferase family protein [Candidatus Cyclobacteriaceae bacterium M3_2C_046]